MTRRSRDRHVNERLSLAAPQYWQPALLVGETRHSRFIFALGRAVAVVPGFVVGGWPSGTCRFGEASEKLLGQS